MRFPLYKIAWRLLWHLPMLVAMGLFLGIIAIRNGWKEATRTYNSM